MTPAAAGVAISARMRSSRSASGISAPVSMGLLIRYYGKRWGTNGEFQKAVLERFEAMDARFDALARRC